jgi:hypothetical protein
MDRAAAIRTERTGNDPSEVKTMKHRIAACVVLMTFAGMWLAAPAYASRTRLSQARMLLQEKKDKKDKKGKGPAVEEIG